MEKDCCEVICKAMLWDRLGLSLLQLVLCRVAAEKRLPVHHHSADYIFSGPLWSFSSFLVIVNRVPLKPVLGGVASVAHTIAGHEQTQ